MYIFFIVLIIIASFLIILAVLAQNPKSGMAANFGASNQVMGVRQTADFLEKFTWGLAVAIVALSLMATMAMPKANIAESNAILQRTEEETENRSIQGFGVGNQLQQGAEDGMALPITPEGAEE